MLDKGLNNVIELINPIYPISLPSKWEKNKKKSMPKI